MSEFMRNLKRLIPGRTTDTAILVIAVVALVVVWLLFFTPLWRP